MKRLIRSLRRRLRYWLNAKTVTIDGVRIVTEQGALPADLRDMLFRDHYEDTERNLLLRLLKPGMRVVEIGTGIGFISLLSARVAGAANVFCYEANTDLEPIIRRNYALNRLEPKLTMRAVTVDGQPITFFKSDNIISSSLYDRKRKDLQVTVQSVAFRDVLQQHDPEVVIMDIEGAEVDLLSQADAKNLQHIIVELHPHIVGEARLDTLLQQLADKGYVVKERDRKTAYFYRPKV